MKFYISCSQFLLESKLNVYMFMAVMYPSHFCRVRVTSPSSQSNLKIFCVVRISADVSWFRVYSDKKSEKSFFFISRNWSQHRCWNIETLASFATFVPFSLLAKQRCHTFFHNGTLLLFSTLYALFHHDNWSNSLQTQQSLDFCWPNFVI